MTLPPGFLDDLRGRTSLARLVGRKLTWDTRKSNTARGDYWAPCPFHQEKSASFHVDDAKGFYYCFGCHAKGDAIAFLRESENMGFMEAVEILARDAGIPMPDRTPEARRTEDRRSRLHAAMEAAVGFYRLQLSTSRAAEARDYLARRGLSPEACARFEIGYAPDGRDTLAAHLAGKGFQSAELAEAGLTGTPDDGRAPYDRFRNRIIFPIRDGRGRAIALGGRALDPNARAKYLNSPETPLFDKGRSLFNLAGARAAAGRGSPLLVAEGYMDVIALVLAGFEAAVAPLGTAITEDQLEQLWRLSPEPLVALDGDRAGRAAAHRLIDLALPRLVSGRSLRFVMLPPGQDPDDCLRIGGRAAMDALIANSVPIVELLWQRETEGQPLDSPERRAALDARLKHHLARIKDESLRAHTAAALRERRAALFSPPGNARPARRPFKKDGTQWKGRRTSAAFPAAASASAKASLLAQPLNGPVPEARIRESAILLGLLNHPALAEVFEDRLDRMTFVCPDLGEIRDALLCCLGDHLPQHAVATPDQASDDGVSSPGRLVARVQHRLGRDPREPLRALGQLRANPHLQADAEPARAALAIEEEMIRHGAWLEKDLEVRDAIEALASAADEALTWRLRQAAEAEDRAARDPLADELQSDGSADLSRHLQDMIDKQVWKKQRVIR